jgi:hypothetical protein
MHHLIQSTPDSGNQMVHSEMHPTRGGYTARFTWQIP